MAEPAGRRDPAVHEAVVLAAGDGTRLRPLTERYAKPVLPVDGRPVVATLLRELAAAGVERVTVVVGRLGDQVERLCGDGGRFGVRVSYARQARPDGSADALAAALAAGARPPFVVTAADTVFRRGDLAAVLAAFAASPAAGALAVRAVPAAEVGDRSLVRVEDGAVVRVLEKPTALPATESGLAGAPVWLLGPGLLPFLDGLSGPPFALAEAFQRAIDAGERIHAVPIGPTRDLTRPADLVRHNFPYLWSER
jgi:dTDP-glucose pyrophosphorylase